MDSNSDGLVDESSTYKIYSDSTAIDLTNQSGRKYSDGTSKYWNVVQAIKVGSGFQVLVAGEGRFEGKYIVLSTDASGVITNNGSGWKDGNQLMELGYEEIFNKDLNADSINGIPSPTDADSDGFIDAYKNVDSNSDGVADSYSSYKLFSDWSSKAIDLTNKNGRTYSDATSKFWNAIKAIKTDSGFQVLLAGERRYEGKFNVLTTDKSGVISNNRGSGWKTAHQMMMGGYENIFDIDLTSDSFKGVPDPVDSDANGLVDSALNYKIFSDSKAINITNERGRTYSDKTSRYWNVSKAVKTESGFQILVSGEDLSRFQGKYNIWNTDATGQILKRTGWKTGHQLMQLGYEEIFDKDLNGDSITGTLSAVDADSNGLVDSTSIFKLFNDSKAIDLTNHRGKTFANPGNYWDAIKAIKTDPGFKLLLSGRANSRYDGKYNIWSADDTGVITTKSGWKNGDEMMELGYEGVFSKDLNGDSITGLPPLVDANSDGFVDAYSSYKLLHESKAIDLINSNGRNYSDSTSKYWNAVKAIKTESGFQVLLGGERRYTGKYMVWSVDESGQINQTSSWYTSEQMIEGNYHNIFDVDLNDTLGLNKSI